MNWRKHLWMNEIDNLFLNSKNLSWNLLKTKEVEYAKLDEDTVEYIFDSRNDKNIAILVLKRYLNEIKNSNSSKNVYIGELNIWFNKNCEIRKPILRISDFYDKDDRIMIYEISIK